MKNLGPRKRMTLRLPSSLGARIDEMAAARGMSTNEFICMEVEKQVARDEMSTGDYIKP